jgi:hypothetical protein
MNRETHGQSPTFPFPFFQTIHAILPMRTILPSILAGIGPFGTAEIIIIAGLLGLVGLGVGGVILFIVLANKKK